MPNIHSRYALDTVSKLSKRPRMVQTPRFKDTTKYDNTVHIHSIPMVLSMHPFSSSFRVKI